MTTPRSYKQFKNKLEKFSSFFLIEEIEEFTEDEYKITELRFVAIEGRNTVKLVTKLLGHINTEISITRARIYLNYYTYLIVLRTLCVVFITRYMEPINPIMNILFYDKDINYKYIK
jgi:hypothetical protein